jgi:hypothetical protein
MRGWHCSWGLRGVASSETSSLFFFFLLFVFQGLALLVAAERR